MIITLMMEAARSSEMSVDNYFTWQYIPEDKSELHTRRRENFKSHNTLHTFLSYLMRTACPTHLTLFYLICLMIFGDEQKL
jgi:hypothetical protein